MEDFKLLPVIGKRPDDVPEAWLIFNAPRPLLGHKEWQGEFEHGIFYVAVNPDEYGAAGFIERNRSSDGWLVKYWTKEEAIVAAKEVLIKKYPTELEAINDLNEKELMRTFYNNFGAE